MFACAVELHLVHLPSAVWAFCHFFGAQDLVGNRITEVEGRGPLNRAQQNGQQDLSKTKLELRNLVRGPLRTIWVIRGRLVLGRHSVITAANLHFQSVALALDCDSTEGTIEPGVTWRITGNVLRAQFVFNLLEGRG